MSIGVRPHRRQPALRAVGRSPHLQPEVRDYEPAVALFAGPDGLQIVTRLVAEAGGVLARGGLLMFEFGAGQAEAVAGLIERSPDFTLIELRHDLQGIPRVAVAQMSIGSVPMCLFCRIINREIPASIVYEDEQVLAFNDINPQAPTHVLIVPKRHIATLNDLQPATMGSSASWCGGRPRSRRNGASPRRVPDGLQHQPRRRPDGLPHPPAPARRPQPRLAAWLVAESPDRRSQVEVASPSTTCDL